MRTRRLCAAAVILLAVLSISRAADGEPLALSKAIDAEILAALQAKGLPAAPAADDAGFCRRVYLDLLGRIPAVAEIEAYLGDPSTDKHHRLIDALLVHPEMPLHWRDLINYWLNDRESKPGLPEFRAYLQKSIADNKPWNQLARELVLPDAGDPAQQPAAYFLASRLSRPNDERLDAITTAVSASLFGVRLECAKCHDHPMVDDWKQDHYYGLASFFNRTQSVQLKNKPALSERADGQVTFVNAQRETRTARLMFLDSKVFDEPPPGSRRKLLAEYAFTRDNPYFKKAIVNRVWKELMGRGLVEPVDQMHSANPATHPKLLELMADDLANHDFNLRRLIAGIMHSEAYRRSSSWPGPGEFPAASSYATANLKPLSPEQLGLSVLLATGHADVVRLKLKEKNASLAAVRLEMEKDLKPFIDRYDSDAARFQASTAQALFMTYNLPAQKLLHPPAGLAARLAKVGDNAELARQAYLTILSRRPADAETAAIVRYLETAGPPREQLCRDVVWALLNSAEFRFNH
jgi:hypothetical protein